MLTVAILLSCDIFPAYATEVEEEQITQSEDSGSEVENTEEVDSYYPVITTQPVSKTVEYGESGGAPLKVVVEATGGGTLSYQWYRVGETEDEKLTDKSAVKKLYLAPKNTLEVRSYYCIVTNTVDGEEYSVKTDVVSVTVYKQYVAKLELYQNGETKVLNGQGYWQGNTFDISLDDVNEYTLKILPINKDMIQEYSMTVSYNGETGTVGEYQQEIKIDTSKFSGGLGGYLTVEVGEYDSDSESYIASELYRFNVTKSLALTDISVSAEESEVNLDMTDAETTGKITTTSAVGANEIKMEITPNSDKAKIYLGESTTEFVSGSVVKLADYQTETVDENTYVQIPVKLEIPAGDDQDAVTREYTLWVLLESFFPAITGQPESAAAEQSLTGNLVLKVVAEATGGGKLSYQWYKVGETEDEKLTDKRATTNLYWVSKQTVGTGSYYCLVTNTVGDKEYSVKTDVVTATIYKSYMRSLTFVTDDKIASSVSGSWQGGEFDISLNDREDYELRLGAIEVMNTSSYSMTMSYNDEAGVREAYKNSVSLDMTKFPYGNTGILTIEIGIYDENTNSYSSSETYLFHIMKFPGLKYLNVTENGTQIDLDTDLSSVENMTVKQTKALQAATGNAVDITATPFENTTEVYIGKSETANSQVTINPADYPNLYEGVIPYVSVPIRLVAPNGTTWEYNLLLQIGEARIKINKNLSDISCYNGDQVSLSVDAISQNGGTLSYQWYKGTEEDNSVIPDATDAAYTPDTSTVGEESYYCVITDTKENNTLSIKSDVAKVNVYDRSDPTPILVVQPKSVVCNKGDENVSVFVQAMVPEGGELTYQWCNKAAYDPIAGATDSTFQIPTEYQYGYYLTCLVTNTVDGKEYSVRSKAVNVNINFTETNGINNAMIVKQPGSYIVNESKEQVDGEYDNTALVGSTANPFYICFTQFDRSVYYKISLYHNTKKEYDGAELVSDVTFTKMSSKGSTSSPVTTYDVKIAPNERYAAGQHFFYVLITLVHESANSGIPSVSTQSEIFEIDFKEGGSELPWEGKGTSEEPYIIKTLDDLLHLQKLVSEGNSFSGNYFNIVNDISLPADWEPIGTKDVPFAGTIDGQINEERNAKITVAVDGFPLLGYVKNATVKNINIYGEQINGAGLINNYTGVGLSGNAAIIENVRLLSGSQTLKSGLVASSGGNGFAVASAGFVLTIRNCVIEEGVTVGYDGTQSQIGSIAGRINGTIENCTSAAVVKGRSYVGGILGTRDNAMSQCQVINCTFSGTVEASSDYAGGIVGGGYDNETAPNGANPTIIGCTVTETGSVKGNRYVGGILGGDGYVAQTWSNVVGSISDNTFLGKVSGSEYVGAIIGYRDSLNRYDTVSNNTYSADCGADKGIGFVKYLDTNYENPTVMEGTIVFNTEKGTSGCPTVAGCAWRSAHNRTDDPLGADANKLCRVIRTKGDLNGDGQITNADVAALLAIVTAQAEEELSVADLNGDGFITNADVAQLLQMTTAA